MKRRLCRIPALAIPTGSLLREFRVRVKVVSLTQLAEATGCVGQRWSPGGRRRVWTPPELVYMRRYEDPPRGRRATEFDHRGWWDGYQYQGAQAAAKLLWRHSKREDRDWLRGMLR